MSSALIEKIIEKNNYPRLTEHDLDGFFTSSEYCVLFFTGEVRSFPESNDVAVALPELMAVFGNRIRVGVVDRESERRLHARYRFSSYPALVFIKNGGYLDVITRIQNWSDYTRQIAEILTLEVSEPPPFDFAKTCAGSQVA